MTFCGFFAKYAGPVATIIAAFTAAGITIYFGFWQARIAEVQKAIARDKLKHDLFAERYAIYQAAKSLLKSAMKHDYERLPSQEIVELKVKLDEARFFFPKDIFALAVEIERACEEHMLQIDRRKIQNPDDDPSHGLHLETRWLEARRRFKVFTTICPSDSSAISGLSNSPAIRIDPLIKSNRSDH